MYEQISEQTSIVVNAEKRVKGYTRIFDISKFLIFPIK